MSDLIMSDLIDFTALELAALIRRREASAREVVESHLARIRLVDPELHAVVRCSESALADADRADRTLARGVEPALLHGVPFTVKDWIETEGLVCDGGYAARQHYLPRADATVVDRMRRAGAILLGKTRAGSDPTLHPVPRHPRVGARTAGSSSGGEAAIIAAHGSPLGLGSDSGGSLRWPAHCCGVVTLKPTAGLVPLTGHFPPIITLTDPRTVIGPLARSVADLAAALDVIAGPDGADPSTVPVRTRQATKPAVRDLRVAWFAGFDGAQASASVCAALAAAVEALRSRAGSVREAVPPRIEEAMDITRAYWARPESMSLDTWQPWGRSTLSADDVEASLFRWDRLRRAFLQFMGDVDIIVCPAAAEVAPARHEPCADDYAFTVPFSLTGNPVVVVKAGTGEEDLPIGVQIVAAPFRDQLALAVAGELEDALGP
jgi:amidase